MCPICYTPIGVIHSGFKEIKGMPLKPETPKSGTGFVELFEEYADELHDIDGFSHVILIYHFHRIHEAKLNAEFKEHPEHGIFATRSPVRPNAMGFSIVKLIAKIDNRLFVDELDAMDKSPLIDIKPFFERYDNRYNTREGWLDDRSKTHHI